MKILVAIESLALGGSQVTAIELAHAVREVHGDESVFFARPGPAEDLLNRRGLSLMPAAIGSELSFVRELRDACRIVRPDVVHAWDRRAVHAAYYAAQLGGLPVLASVTEMLVPPFYPCGVPSTFVTEEIRGSDRRPWVPTWVQDPPINTANDAPGQADGSAFRVEVGAGDDTVLLVIVSRLVHHMKFESTMHAIDAVGLLGPGRRIKLAIVGDGEARAELEERASEVNQALGREAVRLTGSMVDPRPAYAAADAVIGMGTSVVRGMAFEKPAVVVGEQGFAEVFDDTSAERLMNSGFYGWGSGQDIGGRHMATVISRLCERRSEWGDLGHLGREVATARFEVTSVAERLAKTYREVVSLPVDRSAGTTIRNLGRTLGAKVVAGSPDRVRVLVGETTKDPDRVARAEARP